MNQGSPSPQRRTESVLVSRIVPAMAKRTTTIGTRLDAALLSLQLQAQGPAVDATKDRVNGSKPSTQPPPDFGNEHAVWLERAERLVEGIVAGLRQPTATGARKTARELRDVIRGYEGRTVVYVAYHEGCSPDLVEKVRASCGLEPTTGFRRLAALTSREIPVVEGQGND